MRFKVFLLNNKFFKIYQKNISSKNKGLFKIGESVAIIKDSIFQNIFAKSGALIFSNQIPKYILFINNEILICNNSDGNVFELHSFSSLFMTNNTYINISQNLYYVENSKLLLKKEKITNIFIEDKKSFGLFDIEYSTVKLKKLEINNLLSIFENPFIWGLSSNVFLESISFCDMKNNINFKFDLVNLTIIGSNFTNFKKGLIYAQNSKAMIFDCFFHSNNTQNLNMTSNEDIFTNLKIINSSIGIFGTNFSFNRDLFKEAGVQLYLN